MFSVIRMDTGREKSERETENNMEKDGGKGKKHSRMALLETC